MAAKAVKLTFKRAWLGYERALRHHPTVTQTIAGGVIWAAGNAAAQKFVARSEPDREQDFDQGEFLRTTGYGMLCAPLGHWWYIGLHTFTANTLRMSMGWRLVAVKLIADTFIFGSAHIAAFYAWSTVMAGGTWEEAVQKVKSKFLTTFAADVGMWVPAQVINFLFVPPQHNMLYVNILSVAEAALLSWVFDHDITLFSPKVEESAPGKPLVKKQA